MVPLPTLLLSWLLAGSVAADHSIMDLIDTHRVEKLLASRKLNASKELFGPTHNSITDDPEDDQPDIQENSIRKPGKKVQQSSIPDITTVLADLNRPDKLLKSDGTGMIVTKKEYIRKDWCKTEPIVQKIREEGCTPKNVVNRFCYGQCNSFFIPKNLSPRRGRRKRPEDGDDLPSFRSCAFCKPRKTVWVQVTLHCPGQDPPLRRRRVNKVKHCQCMSDNIL